MAPLIAAIKISQWPGDGAVPWRRIAAGMVVLGLAVAGLLYALAPKSAGAEVLGSVKSFRDAGCQGGCPEMVVVPSGKFTMGSRDGESNEKPTHQVTIAKPFAVGKYPVTFDEWDACVAAGACNNYKPDDNGWGRGTRPVINVSWNDAKSYVAWLSAKTGQGYRLLSEAEWEYAARAGTTEKYYWGDAIGKGNANCSGCGSQWDKKWPSPVGSFKPNAFGLYDMLGNVSQWCEDTKQSDYHGAPTDGSAWIVASVSSRVLRGGSWYSVPKYIRSASRNNYFHLPDYRYSIVGFRVARTLLPPTP